MQVVASQTLLNYLKLLFRYWPVLLTEFHSSSILHGVKNTMYTKTCSMIVHYQSTYDH